MNIQIANNVLDDPTWHPLLDVLATMFCVQGSRTTFDIRQHAQVLASPWLRGARGARAATAQLLRSATRAAFHVQPSIAVTVRLDLQAPVYGRIPQQSMIEIHPSRALAVLMQPLHVIVEDENSDGAFLLWMARLLGRDVIREAYSNGQLLFRHAGGKNQFPKCARALSFGVWPRAGRPILSLQFRAIAMLDSDSRYPGDTPNVSIAKETLENVAHVHILNGRTIENYVPLRYARKRLAQDGLEPLADAFFRMSDLQREHFPMKRGYVDDGVPAKPLPLSQFLSDQRFDPPERAQFSGIGAQDWALFAGGFGTRLAAVFQDPGLRCEPQDSHLLTPRQRVELNALMSKIIDHL